MKHVIIIKQECSIQLAHLYEHIFCSHLENWFYHKHLFPHLDYSITGRTFYRGIVYISVDLYTAEAISLASEIAHLEVAFDKATMPTAASQLMAEKEQPFNNLGYDEVKQALQELHARPWQDMDSVGVIDTTAIRRKANPFYVIEGQRLAARKLKANVVLDAEIAASHRQLVPLFRQFAWLIVETLQAVLANTYGYYSFDRTFNHSTRAVGLSTTFKVAQGHDVDVPDNLTRCLEVVSYMRRHEAFARLTTELQTMSYYNRAYAAPDPEKTYKDTFILIGSKGWRETATAQNGNLLLENMAIELKFGRDRISHGLLSEYPDTGPRRVHTFQPEK